MAEDKKDKKHEGIQLGVKSTAQLDLEERAARDFEVPGAHRVNLGRLDPTGGEEVSAVEGNDQSAYRGVNPEYMNYANEADKPLDAEEGAELVVLGIIDDSTEEPEFVDAKDVPKVSVPNAPAAPTAPAAPGRPVTKTATTK